MVAFPDIAPRAPTHILLIPREHIVSAAALTDDDAPMVGRLFAVAARIARDAGIADAGLPARDQHRPERRARRWTTSTST